jgi:metallo-beta-lactamase class B
MRACSFAALAFAALSLAALAALLGVPALAEAQDADQRIAWNQPVEPFRLLGRIHYVGAAGVSSFFIETSAGGILLDGGLPETAPLIEKNIEKLGFRLTQVKYLLNSHAHFDHSGGLPELEKKSRATLVVSEKDAPALRSGNANQPSVAVDRVVKDGDVVRLGDTTLTAHLTPGHTKGCTTWTMTATEAGKDYKVVFYCSTSVTDHLLGNASYPDIVADYERSFRFLRALPSDVFLAPHPDMFRMASKRERAKADGANPFIDPSELARYVDRSEQAFRKALAEERRAPVPTPAPAKP